MAEERQQPGLLRLQRGLPRKTEAVWHAVWLSATVTTHTPLLHTTITRHLPATLSLQTMKLPLLIDLAAAAACAIFISGLCTDDQTPGSNATRHVVRVSVGCVSIAVARRTHTVSV